MNTIFFLLFLGFSGIFSSKSYERFYKFLGPPFFSSERCEIRTSDCSCEPVVDPDAPFLLARENGKVIKMCFDNLELPYNIYRDSLVAPCRINSDCAEYLNAYCHGQHLNLDLYDDVLDEIVHQGGICITDDPPLEPLPSYLLPYPDSYVGKLTVNGSNCRGHLDCVGAGDQGNKERSVNYCNKNTTSGKGVCQLFLTHPNPCGPIHLPKTPLIFCGIQDSICSRSIRNGFCGVGGVCCEYKSDEIIPPKCPIGEMIPKICQKDSECDHVENGFCWKEDYDEESNSGWCCKTPYPTICPDTVTNHRLEPKCSSTLPCLNGLCQFGHCCPTTNYNRTTKQTTQTTLWPYLTNQPCTPSKFFEQPGVRAFCDPDRKRYVVIGTENVELGIEGKECRINRDCRGFDLVCVRTFENGTCYHNPLKPRINPTLRLRYLTRALWSFSILNATLAIMTLISFNFKMELKFCEGFKFLSCLNLENVEEEEENGDDFDQEWEELKIQEISGTDDDLEE